LVFWVFLCSSPIIFGLTLLYTKKERKKKEERRKKKEERRKKKEERRKKKEERRGAVQGDHITCESGSVRHPDNLPSGLISFRVSGASQPLGFLACCRPFLLCFFLLAPFGTLACCWPLFCFWPKSALLFEAINAATCQPLAPLVASVSLHHRLPFSIFKLKLPKSSTLSLKGMLEFMKKTYYIFCIFYIWLILKYFLFMN